MRLYRFYLLLGFLAACQTSTPEKKYISAPSMIEQQVQHIDTALYSIKKYTTLDTSGTDTTYVKREEFRKEVETFLSIPDLSDPKQAKLFQEETRYDELMKRVIISYTPLNPNEQSFTRIELFIEPDLAAGDKVKTILATRRINNRNGFEQTEMIWQMDRSCTKILTNQKPGGIEEVQILKWSWNE